jgi:5-methylcytosine-specific restriction protein A
MQRAGKRCGTPGCNNSATASGYCAERCNARQERGRRRTTPTKVARTHQVAQYRRATVAAWRAQHGDWCPGYQRDGHAASDLCADDPIPIARGGDPMQPLQILCNACNASKGAR